MIAPRVNDLSGYLQGFETRSISVEINEHPQECRGGERLSDHSAAHLYL